METQVAQPQRRPLLRSDAMQRLLAFGALIPLVRRVSIASPYFLQFDQHHWHLPGHCCQRPAGAGCHLRHYHRSIDLSVGTVMTLSSVMAGVFITMWRLPVPVGILAAVRYRRVVRPDQWFDHCQAEDATLCGHAGHVVCGQGAFAGLFRLEACLFRRYARLPGDFHWGRSRAPLSRTGDPERGIVCSARPSSPA